MPSPVANRLGRPQQSTHVVGVAWCRYIFSWQSLVDIVTILPIFLSVFVSSRVRSCAIWLTCNSAILTNTTAKSDVDGSCHCKQGWQQLACETHEVAAAVAHGRCQGLPLLRPWCASSGLLGCSASSAWASA